LERVKVVMELKTYLAILWRRKWIIVITTIVTVGLTVAGSFAITQKYKTAATLRVSATGGPVSYGDLLYAQRLMNTYPSIITSTPFLAQLKQRLGIDDLPEITVEFPPESELMQIGVEGENPVGLAEVANTLADILIDENKKTKAGRSFVITLVDPAIMPENPSGPGKEIYIIMGVALGLMGGLGLAFLFENLDTRLHSKQQIEAASDDLTILAQIPSVKRRKSATFLNGATPEGEAFRRLRTNILTLGKDSGLRTILVTSPEPRDGKSTTITNLAIALAHTGRNVVVVDGDLRRPTIHTSFDLSNQNGLSSVLTQKTKLADALQDSHIAGTTVLTSGPILPHPAELLGTSEMTTLLDELSQAFDFVLVDAPALLPVIDAAILAPTVDGVLLVISRGRTRQEDIRATCRQLTISKANIIGAVVNRTGSDNYYSSYFRDIKEL